jgi:spore coat polysaccharide biosynthesis protein SpsF
MSPQNSARILGVLQARTSSSRLPGKVMLPILDQPMILRQIERLKRVQCLDGLVLATSTDPSDDALATTVAASGIPVHRGSLDNVLERFIGAAAPFHPEWVVRLTGDCPLADPQLIDRLISETLSSGADYGSTALAPTFPDGLDAEIVRFDILRQIACEPRTTAEREHVTLAIHRNPDLFQLQSVTGSPDLSALRWTVDEPRDFAFVTAVYEALYPANPVFSTDDILRLLQNHPELARMNGDIQRNEGLLKSLAAEGRIA